MARITIEQISEELSQNNWKILSTEYQNLDSELHFQCPEGHDVYSSWKKMRTQLICPVCKQNKFLISDMTIIPKTKGVKRVLALDQASHITGWAIFDGKELVKYGTFETTDEHEINRFNEVKHWLLSMIENWRPDMIGIEGIQYQESFGVTTFQTLARLQGILMDTCFELGIGYMICPTNTWRAHCGVKGRSRSDKKQSMQMLIKQWFDISVNNDISDAIGIGKYVVDTYGKQVDIVSWI